MPTALHTLTEIAARILGEPAHDLDVDLDVEELGLDGDDCHDMMEEAAQAHGVPLIDIINTMPVYRIKRGDMVMWSLVDLAAFSPRAAQMVATFTIKMQIDTLRSLATSIETGRYVSSGQTTGDMHVPNTPPWVLGKAGGIWGMALGLPLLNAFGPCNPICRNCFAPPDVKFWEIGVYSLPVALVATVLWLGPGLFNMWDTSRRKKARGKKRRALSSKDPARTPAPSPAPE